MIERMTEEDRRLIVQDLLKEVQMREIPQTKFYYYVTSHGTICKAQRGRSPESDYGRDEMGNSFETAQNAREGMRKIKSALYSPHKQTSEIRRIRFAAEGSK